MYWIGLDEAGYGPTLGPLCHGVSVFHLPGHPQPPDLWVHFSELVSRHPAPAGRLCVDDSKKVYGETGGMAELFHSVTHFLNCSLPKTLKFGTEEELLAALLHGDDQGDLAADPWGIARSDAEAVEPFSVPLKELLASKNAAFVYLNSSAYPARSFNAWLARNPKSNKADLNWSRAQRLLKLALETLEKHAQTRKATADPVFITVDRQGGRKFYAAPLSQVFEGAFVEVIEEKDARSAYCVEYRSRKVQVEFVVQGDSAAFPVALSALAAKFTREVAMQRFNAYFSKAIPGLKPTAGYPTDARRFLKDSAGFRKKQGIADDDLIRRK